VPCDLPWPTRACSIEPMAIANATSSFGDCQLALANTPEFQALSRGELTNTPGQRRAPHN
jgi:hypothetical protein